MQANNPRKSKQTLFLSTMFVGLLASAILIIYSGQTDLTLAQTTERDPSKIKVRTSVDKLQIVASKISSGRLTITIRNNFEKPINAFYLSSGNVTYESELIFSDFRDSVLPGTEYEISIGGEGATFDAGVTINAILFEDGTGSGEAGYTRMMRDKRAGLKIGFERGESLLDELLSHNSLKSTDVLSQLKKRYIDSDTVAPSWSEEVKFGVHSGRQRYLRYINDLEDRYEKDKTVEIDMELNRISARLKKYLSKL